MGEAMREAFARAAEQMKAAVANVKCAECGEVGCFRASCAMRMAGHEPTLCGQWTRDPEWHVSHCRECRLQRARARNLVERLSLLVDAVQSEHWISERIQRRRITWGEAYDQSRAQSRRLYERAVRIEAKYLKEGT